MPKDEQVLPDSKAYDCRLSRAQFHEKFGEKHKFTYAQLNVDNLQNSVGNSSAYFSEQFRTICAVDCPISTSRREKRAERLTRLTLTDQIKYLLIFPHRQHLQSLIWPKPFFVASPDSREFCGVLESSAPEFPLLSGLDVSACVACCPWL